jgi:hypothetical protein
VKPRTTYCYTCKSREEHRPLTKEEEGWVEEEIGRRYTGILLMCMAKDCRNLRTGCNKRPFHPVRRLPTTLE